MSCFGYDNEQIYLADILVEKLTLTNSKVKGIDMQSFVIKIKMLDLNFEITHERKETPEIERKNSECFRNGGCFLFVMKPQKLIDNLNTTKIKIGVYHDKDNFPTAETDLILKDCLCSQTVIGSDPKKLPDPMFKKNKYPLYDLGKNLFGHLFMELRIECIGRTVATRYEVYDRYSKIDLSKIWELCLRRYVPFEFFGEHPIKHPTAPQEEIAGTAEDAELPKQKKEWDVIRPKKKKKKKKTKGKK